MTHQGGGHSNVNGGSSHARHLIRFPLSIQQEVAKLDDSSLILSPGV